MKTIFQTEHFGFYGRDSNGGAINKWVKQLAFFEGDLTSVDTSVDWRFKANNTRTESVLLATVNSIAFPITYPIHTNEGRIIHDTYDCVKYDDEDDYNANL